MSVKICSDLRSALFAIHFNCEDAGESFGRFDFVSRENESEDHAQLSSAHLSDRVAHSGQALSDCPRRDR